MNLPAWLNELLTVALRLSYGQQLGLAFLLGSFTVATWSDLKYLAAQREFLEVWLLFLVCVLIHDVYRVHTGAMDWVMPLGKWVLLTLLAVLSLKEVGVLFRLARGDVAALAAAASLLPPLLILVFFAAAKGIAFALEPLLRRGRPYWPFMPVVTLSTLVVLGLGWLAGG
jgi:hypothetical protein